MVKKLTKAEMRRQIANRAGLSLAEVRRRETNHGMEVAQLENTEVALLVHAKDRCAGEQCTIHNRSDHSMRTFPQLWRNDRGIMERICEHGTGHPDPDDIRIMNGADSGIHGCDGCCGPTSVRDVNVALLALEESESPVYGSADHDYEIVYVVRERTNAPPSGLDRVEMVFRRELALQFGSTITVERRAIIDHKHGGKHLAQHD